MKHKSEADASNPIRGLVLDHETRHPDMKRVEDAYILTYNVSLEYEKAEIRILASFTRLQRREREVSES